MTDAINRETPTLLTAGNQTATEIVEQYPLFRPGAISGLLEVLRERGRGRHRYRPADT